MSSPQAFTEIKAMRKRSRDRREAIARFLKANDGLVRRVAARAEVDRSMVYKVLHGHAVSENVERAIARETEATEQTAA